MDEGPTFIDRRPEVIYRIKLSHLYHQRREAYFSAADQGLSWLLALSATAAVATFYKVVKVDGAIEAGASLITAALAVLQLAWVPATKARHHAHKAYEFRRLLAEGERAGVRWTEEQSNDFYARVIEIEADEPAALPALVADCQNLLAISSDGPCVRLLFHERLLMHWVEFDAVTIHSRVPKKPK